ncbi:divalent metal cation transporter [Alteromonas aestuariivivens]|uniref:Divalent metal cation transporter n=1 Tax=Alteromonas aestuariivivens TaxID=1938339 RepID=A0A3D8M3U6_9ALTE|nr:divalent metal cation transporter [Alteromonas aestuariivivens]RDV24225.1 divalent metal cation transporter [Alteromonas aestuariivivens]
MENIRRLIRLMGPGILMATAAVGGSHLVASTQAGAQFGWQLALLILAVNLFKYPFFRASVSYTYSTRNTLQQGYRDMGKGYLLVSFMLNIVAAVVNTAALLMFAASLLGYFLPFELPMAALASVVLAVVLVIIIAGHFSAINRASKAIMAVLIMATVIALLMAWNEGAVAPPEFTSPSPWTLATIGFLVVTMGWMPAPIEVSCLTSLWLKQQCNENPVTAQSALFDFNLGYFITLLLALVFLALGALVLHGNGETLASGGIGFSSQLINLYAHTIGEWSRYLVALIAFLCIFGSTLTVYDGYCRALAEGMTLLKGQEKAPDKVFLGWLVAVAVVSFGIVLFFKSALLPMLSFAMTLAFITTPMFAWLNHRLVKRAELDPALKGGIVLQMLTYSGLIYLFGFLLAFVAWKWWG